ncbi:MAG: DUF2318 domain-containing protein [Desulfovibrio sp.]|nr:DUF2318 domain-containing protein [Desulfovibrio sp.]
MRYPHSTGYSTARAIARPFDHKLCALVLTALALCCALFAAPAHAGPFDGLFGGETTLEIKDGSVSLPVSGVSDKASFYKVKVDGTNVIFFALLDSAGRVRVALDACDSCWQSGKGYKQNGDSMVCQNCGMAFHSDRISMRKGGCNPHPVSYSIAGDSVVIPAAEIQAGVKFFGTR